MNRNAGMFAVLFPAFLSLLLSLTSLLLFLLPPAGGETVDELIRDGVDVSDAVNFVAIVLAPEKFALEAIIFVNPPLEALLLYIDCPKDCGSCPEVTTHLFVVNDVADILLDIPAVAPLFVTITVCCIIVGINGAAPDCC